MGAISVSKEIRNTWRHYEYLMLPPKNEPAKRMVRVHDIFNVLVLPIVVILDIRFVLGGNLDEYSNPRFWLFYWGTTLYILVDTVWVALFPNCVKSVITIILHHAVTLLYMGVPAYNATTRYAMAVDLTVEVNTWLLI